MVLLAKLPPGGFIFIHEILCHRLKCWEEMRINYYIVKISVGFPIIRLFLDKANKIVLFAIEYNLQN